MILSFIYYVALSKFVDSAFPQCNVHTGVQGGFTPLDGYLKLWKLYSLPIPMPRLKSKALSGVVYALSIANSIFNWSIVSR